VNREAMIEPTMMKITLLVRSASQPPRGLKATETKVPVAIRNPMWEGLRPMLSRKGGMKMNMVAKSE
jgi:hypothetical protein